MRFILSAVESKHRPHDVLRFSRWFKGKKSIDSLFEILRSKKTIQKTSFGPTPFLSNIHLDQGLYKAVPVSLSSGMAASNLICH